MANRTTVCRLVNRMAATLRDQNGMIPEHISRMAVSILREEDNKTAWAVNSRGELFVVEGSDAVTAYGR